MFSGLKIALVFIILAGAGGGLFYVKQLQSNLEIQRLNNAKLEQAVETSQQSLATLKADNARLNTLTDTLNTELDKSEQYGDELRATLSKHNLTHLANKKPGLIEKRMQNATNKLWDNLESITSNTPTE
jgi:septal ring factor EnvC (AmiA/AmiB activator)|tara:strand:- start:476 stop:862 length:387 start_codon:yes stop_codon:yes gene_type:complete